MKRFWEYLSLTVGSFIVAAGLELILAPNGLVDGGVTAIAIMSHKLWEIPLWVVFLGLNLPILLFTTKVTGKRFVIRTLYANAVTTVGLILFKPIPAITTSEVLIVLYGGLLLGVGIGLVVKTGGAIDGTEMLAVWFHKRFHIPITTFLLVLNAVIFATAAFVYTLEKAMFSLAVFYIVTKMIDFVMDGLNQAKSVMIISEKPEEVGKRLVHDLEVSLTFLRGEGGYSGDEKRIIYCIVDRLEYPKLKELVLEIDPGAIMEASYVAETAGVKYKPLFPYPKS
ncbi:YitT family protein [Melghirimyces algeriensis]|uniref:Uncharacterized membrane-anchored protein YitT, contains DUF161 and DUF2179 domains n=1 Tax=Melghirimyces algeriensis TaxID=910412 RepID=A0A521C7Q4_9BACL|nr:YitT family protein [Melghirimyces algeriensis]SMO55424.1 Uncharacterized membrane-anchored protein YitT, contains DUF161 and DUF2179 domains [Melghirimyces algeriensis]